MKIKLFGLIAVLGFALAGVSFGASVSDYQVTGPIAEVDSSKIVVEKGAKKERFEIARDSNTKADAEPKVGDKVTVHYTMTATNIEMKAGKGEKGTKKEKASPATSPKS